MTSNREKSPDVDLGPPYSCAHTCMHICTYPVCISYMYTTTTTYILKKKSFSLGMKKT